MSRRANPLSTRLYKTGGWFSIYSSPLHRNAKVFHQTACIDLYLRTKIGQRRLFLKKQSFKKRSFS
jgi:hypothetical protein